MYVCVRVHVRAYGSVYAKPWNLNFMGALKSHLLFKFSNTHESNKYYMNER